MQKAIFKILPKTDFFSRVPNVKVLLNVQLKYYFIKESYRALKHLLE